MALFDARERLTRRYALPVAMILAMALVIFSELTHQKAGQVIAERNDITSHRSKVAQLLRLMLSAESGQRGYLLTGRSDYKTPYTRAVVEIDLLLPEVNKQYAGAPDRAADAQELTSLVHKKLDEMSTTVTMFESGNVLWRDLLLTDIGRETMMSIDALSRSLADHETKRLENRKNMLERTLRLSRAGIILLVLLSLIVLLALTRKARRLDAERRGRAQELLGERNRLEVEVEHRTRDLNDIAKHLQTAREDERRRIARELHDELGGLLTAAKLDVARMRKRLPDASQEVTERIEHLTQTLDAGISLKRRIIEDLHPSSLVSLGLTPSLTILCSEFADSSGIQVLSDLADIQLPPDVQITIYRLVQEALTNVAKHAQAQRVDVALSLSEGWVTVVVRDNGIGFDTSGVSRESHGLAGMRFRARSALGELRVQSTPGAGSCITCRLPHHLPPATGPTAASTQISEPAASPHL